MKAFGGELREIWMIFAFFDTLLSSCYIEGIQPEIWHELWHGLLHFKHMYPLVYSIKHYPKEPAANGTAMAECYMAEAGGKGAGKWD